MFRNLVIAAIAAAAMTSCSKSDEGVNSNGPVEVRFAANTAQAQTRVNDDKWNNGDPIGVYMVDHGFFTVAENATNIRYSTSSNEKEASFTSTTPIYFPVNGSKVDFIAYHPYQALSNWKYEVNVATQTTQSAIDLMWSGVVNNATNGYDKSQAANPINLDFKHQLVKLKLTVETSISVTDLTGLTVKIAGMNTTADFNVQAGNLDNIGAAADITPLKNAGSYEYEAILLPVATLGTGHLIEFAVGGNTYKWNLSGAGGIDGGKLEGGKMYSYTVKANKTTVEVKGTITAWDSKTGTGTAK